MKVKSFSRVKLFTTAWTVAYQAPLHGIFQARILEWVAIAFSISLVHIHIPPHPTPPEGRLLFCINHLVCINSLGTTSPSNQLEDVENHPEAQVPRH